MSEAMPEPAERDEIARVLGGIPNFPEGPSTGWRSNGSVA